MRKRIKRVRRWVWLLCGGGNIESGFLCLSQSIQHNRKLLSELRARNVQLEARVWELEGHTVQETCKMGMAELDKWVKACEVLKESAK